tara:strand:+ start:6226 stop:8103 length:1878 start_codon:yes stop_codon:yes gene_type:complete
MIKVSVFDSLTNTSNPKQTDLFKVLNLIKTGGTMKSELIRLRGLEGDEYKAVKKKLPIILFNGTFGNRSKDGIINGSGLLTLDFDEGSQADLEALRESLNGESYTVSTFASPRGQGRFKALIHIPITSSDTEYKEYFAALEKKYPTLDKSGKDISRANFFSFDPDMYVNEKPTVWAKRLGRKIKDRSSIKSTVKDWGSVNNALRKIEDAEEGFKHLSRTKIGFLFGGWIAAKQISHPDAMKLLEAAVEKNTSDLKGAMKTIEDCVSAGMNQPLTMTAQKEVLKMEFSAPRRYVPMSEVMDDVMEFYENGYQKGWDIGFDCARYNISILAGSTSYWYAAPYQGKSQVWHEILMNITEAQVGDGNPFYNLILSPETGDVAQVYGELISIYAKKAFVGDFKMTKVEMKVAADFIARHFLLLDYGGDAATMADILIQAEAAEREFGIKFNTLTIDPMNYLDFDEGKYSRRDLVIARDLSLFLADARKNNRHNALITHARDQSVLTNNEKQRYYPVVTPREILDGQQFFRKGMAMASIYRPIDTEGKPLPDSNGELAEDNETNVWIQKAKPKGIGKNGMFKLYYDFKANRYYEIDSDGNEWFAWKVPRGFHVEPISVSNDKAISLPWRDD